MVTRESLYFINLRQAYFMSPLYASRISSKTVLFTSVPRDVLDEAKIRRLYGNDKVKKVWLVTDTKKLAEMVDEREKAAFKLEAAETKLIKLATKARVKANGATLDENTDSPKPPTQDGVEDGESGSVAARWVKPSDRPTHKLKMIIGKKVDTINWARQEIERLTPEIEALQAQHRVGDGKLVNSVFVEFYTQNEAQAAYQMRMSSSFLCLLLPLRRDSPANPAYSCAQSTPAHGPSLYRCDSREHHLVQFEDQVVGAHYQKRRNDRLCRRSCHILGHPCRVRRRHFQRELLDRTAALAFVH